MQHIKIGSRGSWYQASSIACKCVLILKKQTKLAGRKIPIVSLQNLPLCLTVEYNCFISDTWDFQKGILPPESWVANANRQLEMQKQVLLHFASHRQCVRLLACPNHKGNSEGHGGGRLRPLWVHLHPRVRDETTHKPGKSSDTGQIWVITCSRTGWIQIVEWKQKVSSTGLVEESKSISRPSVLETEIK